MNIFQTDTLPTRLLKQYTLRNWNFPRNLKPGPEDTETLLPRGETTDQRAKDGPVQGEPHHTSVSLTSGPKNNGFVEVTGSLCPFPQYVGYIE